MYFGSRGKVGEMLTNSSCSKKEIKKSIGKVRGKEKIEMVDTKLIPQLRRDRRTNNI